MESLPQMILTRNRSKRNESVKTIEYSVQSLIWDIIPQEGIVQNISSFMPFNWKSDGKEISEKRVSDKNIAI